MHIYQSHKWILTPSIQARITRCWKSSCSDLNFLAKAHFYQTGVNWLRNGVGWNYLELMRINQAAPYVKLRVVWVGSAEPNPTVLTKY